MKYINIQDKLLIKKIEKVNKSFNKFFNQIQKDKIEEENK